MAQVNVLEQNATKEGDKVVVTKTTEEHLTRDDLIQAKQNLFYQRQSLFNQLDQLKKQVAELDVKEQDIDSMLTMLEQDTLAV